MNFIQTLYISPDKNPFKDSFGWISPEYHLMGWALSCLQLKQVYGKANLYANDTAVDLLMVVPVSLLQAALMQVVERRLETPPLGVHNL